MQKRTAISIATMNMNGFGNLRPDHPDNKWRTMYKMIKNNRIGILLLQETHLTPERRESVSSMFKGRIKILYSAHPDSPTRREGVAVILNKSQVCTKGAEILEIVAGRAIQLSVRCHGDETMHILCIYAPTSDGLEERKAFFQNVKTFYETHPTVPRPTLMAGDFNNVEDAIDRLPVSEPDTSLTDLDSLKLALGLMLVDGWRATFPTERCYTFHRGSGADATCSRLDRIYVSDETFERAREWQIRPPAIKTDHSLVSVQISMADAPAVGKGRPTFALHLVKDKQLAKRMKASGIKAQDQIEAMVNLNNRTTQHNPQTILYDLKREWLRMARDREQELVPKMILEIKEMTLERKNLQNNMSLSDQQRAKYAAELTSKITALEIKRTLQQQLAGKAKHKLEGERPTKYWTRIHKPCAPREVIHAFEREDQRDQHGNRIYETDSTKMAEMACSHHSRMQDDEEGVPEQGQREQCIQEALRSLDQSLNDIERESMGKDITYSECELALKTAKSGTAPGRDGIPYEVYKTMHARFVEDSRHEDREAFDIVKVLHSVCIDIQIHGVAESVPFTEGWMAPIYKGKGERSQVVNYRPITLLNTDYKILTKVLSIRL
ncbi:DNase I-like protein, partial [Trametes coccinea BRFM310]